MNRLPRCVQTALTPSKCTWQACSHYMTQVMISLELINIFCRISRHLQKLFTKSNSSDVRYNFNLYLSFCIFNFYVVNGNLEVNFPQLTCFHTSLTLFDVICKLQKSRLPSKIHIWTTWQELLNFFTITINFLFFVILISFVYKFQKHVCTVDDESSILNLLLCQITQK